ncbi:MAG: hypothetical protein P8009_00490 [Gammaproteobacteria bacterium]
MSIRLTLFAALAVLLSGLVAGCYESPDATLHEPGVYKGDRDPLQALEKTEKQQQRLRDRFNLVQTDR